MKEAALLALSEGMELDQIQITETGLVVSVISTSPQSCCPLCSQPSSYIHSHYHRTLKDAPCVGRQLQLSLTVRKFFCRNPLCSRKVFDLSPQDAGRAVGTDDDQAETSKSRLLVWRPAARVEFDWLIA
jgi:transposase